LCSQNVLCELKAVHARHLDVRKNQPYRSGATLLLETGLVECQSFSAIFKTLTLNIVFQEKHCVKWDQIELFVINEDHSVLAFRGANCGAFPLLKFKTSTKRIILDRKI